MKNKNPKFGVRPDKKDSRDFRLGMIFDLPEWEEVPESFELEPLDIKDQKSSDYCTGFTATYMSELQEGVELSPEWHFAMSKVISGDVEGWGQRPRPAMKVSVKWGDIPVEEAPYSVEDDYMKIRDIKEWPVELRDKAKKHRKQSYFKVTGEYDEPFKDMVAAMWKFFDKKRAVSFSLDWGYPLDQHRIDEFKQGTGHMMTAVGRNGDYLKCVQSYGKDAGNNGYHLIHKDVVNKNVEKYGGNYMFVDMPPERVKSEWSIWQRIVDFFKKLIRKI